jgi:WD40 repeat protein
VNARCAFLLFLVCSLATLSGCSRGKGVQKAVPSSNRSNLSSEPKPPPAYVEPEPAPGEPIRLALPADGGSWPWPVGKAEDKGESRPISFPNLPPYSVTGIAVRPDVNRAVASIKWEKKGQPAITRICLCDTANGKILSEWPVPAQQAVIDLSPDGRAFLSTHSQPGKDRNTLRLWIIGTDGQLRRFAWKPHTPTRPDCIRYEPGERTDPLIAQEIKWAGFVGNDRIVSLSRLGQLRIFETDGNKALGSVEGSPCRPAISPDGSKIAFITGNSVTLVDPFACTVYGTRWVGQIPPHPALAFSPDGGRLAIAGNGKALFLNLTSGDVQEAILPKLHVTDSAIYDKPFGWVGNNSLYADSHLHDLRFPASVWDYTGVEHVQFCGTRIWACVRPSGSASSTIFAYSLPDAQTIDSIDTACHRPELFAFKVGDSIRVDVTGVPENKRGEVQTVLEQRLQALGYKVDPTATTILFASVDTTGTKTGTAYSGFEPYAYMKKPAILRLVANGKELWSEAWAIEPPFTIRCAPAVALGDHLKQFGIGEPNYKLFSTAPIPSYFPGPQAPTSSFGTTELLGMRLPIWLPW